MKGEWERGEKRKGEGEKEKIKIYTKKRRKRGRREGGDHPTNQHQNFGEGGKRATATKPNVGEE